MTAGEALSVKSITFERVCNGSRHVRPAWIQRSDKDVAEIRRACRSIINSNECDCYHNNTVTFTTEPLALLGYKSLADSDRAVRRMSRSRHDRETPRRRNPRHDLAPPIKFHDCTNASEKREDSNAQGCASSPKNAAHELLDAGWTDRRVDRASGSGDRTYRNHADLVIESNPIDH